MGRIQPESFWLICPAFADLFVGRQAFEGLETPGVIVGVDEVIEMGFELLMAVVVIAFDGGFLDRPVNPLDLDRFILIWNRHGAAIPYEDETV